MTYLTCTQLDVGHAGHAVARGISCTVGPHDLVCVVGENGTGKSTFVKTILGLIPPVGGGFELSETGGRGAVGYVPQRAEVKGDFPASAREVVLSGRLAQLGSRPFFRKEDRAAALDALEQVGAGELASRSFSRLSGGQQQRVLLARALAADARLLVLDEPTTGLDPDATAALYATLDELREEGRGILAVTHDVDEARLHATHLLSFELSKEPVFSAIRGRDGDPANDRNGIEIMSSPATQPEEVVA